MSARVSTRSLSTMGPAGADDSPGEDVRFGARLVHDPADEGAVPGVLVDAAVEWADLIGPLLGIRRIVDVTDRPSVEHDAVIDPRRQLRMCTAPGVEDAD